MNNKKIISTLPIENIDFNPISENELSIIGAYKNKNLFSAFTSRAIISVIVIAIIMIAEYIGRHSTNTSKTIPGMIVFLIIVLMVFNLLSFIYMVLKKKIDLYNNHLSCVYGTVSEKYNKHLLSRQNNEKSNDYILFDKDSIHCSTAIKVADYDVFKHLEIGDEVIIVKVELYGDISYELYNIPTKKVLTSL